MCWIARRPCAVGRKQEKPMVSRYATQMSPERRSSRYAVRSSRSPSALFSRRHSSFWLRTATPSSPAAHRASEAAVGADVERALLVAPFRPDDFAGQAFARRVDAPQAAADGTVQAGDADPDRAFAIFCRGPRPRRRQALRRADHVPGAALFLIEEAGIGRDPERSLLVEREIAHVARARQHLGEVFQLFLPFGERPQVAGGARPDGAFAIAHDRGDALGLGFVAEPLPGALRENAPGRRRDHA